MTKPIHFLRPGRQIRNALWLMAIVWALQCYGRPHIPVNIDSLWRLGNQQEKAFHDSEALATYLALLAIDPNHYDALCKAARISARLGGRTASASEALAWTTRSASLAMRAIRLRPRDARAHVEYLIALGMMANVAGGPFEKLQHASLIRQEADVILRLDSGCATAHYILGKWHHGISQLGWAERFVVSSILDGKFREASMDRAIFHFTRAVDLAPDCILFKYGLSQAYLADNRREIARTLIKTTLLMPSLEPDDDIRKENCLILLQQIESH